MARRLPVYLLIDTSSSMTGEPIEAVNEGMKLLVSSLRQDPQALESASLSVITFDDEANVVVPLTDLLSFQVPTLQVNGSTMMGEGLSLVVDRVGAEVQKGTSEGERGDWRPLLFVMTDGAPTDRGDFERGVKRIKEIKFGAIVACAAGAQANEAVLREITENVVKISTADSQSIAAFFKWVSASVSVRSASVNRSNDQSKDDALPPPPPELTPIA